jgi:hypothetical protein
VDLNSFLRQRRPGWEALEALLREVDRVGMRGLSLEQARELAARYRAASEDLVKARGMTANAEILEYLNGLVGRAYGHIYATRGSHGAGCGRSGRGATRGWCAASGA